MAKEKPASMIDVQLLCFYASSDHTANPGDIISVDAEEAARLIELKVATPVAKEQVATEVAKDEAV